jgi:hypothetical protein
VLAVLALVDATGRHDREVCASAGVGRNTLSLLRSGTPEHPRRHTLNLILVALGVPFDERRAILAQAKPHRRPRGVQIPEPLRADWQMLKRKGFRNAEAAQMLGIDIGAPPQ